MSPSGRDRREYAVSPEASAWLARQWVWGVEASLAQIAPGMRVRVAGGDGAS